MILSQRRQRFSWNGVSMKARSQTLSCVACLKLLGAYHLRSWSGDGTCVGAESAALTLRLRGI